MSMKNNKNKNNSSKFIFAQGDPIVFRIAVATPADTTTSTACGGTIGGRLGPSSVDGGANFKSSTPPSHEEACASGSPIIKLSSFRSRACCIACNFLISTIIAPLIIYGDSPSWSNTDDSDFQYPGNTADTNIPSWLETDYNLSKIQIHRCPELYTTTSHHDYRVFQSTRHDKGIDNMKKSGIGEYL